MIVLVDQDGVLADFEGRFFELWQKIYPYEFCPPTDKRTSFEITLEFPPVLRDRVRALYSSPGFVLNLPPIAGAIEAVNTIVELGHTVRICTSPVTDYENCVLEKYMWIERYFGREFTRNLILTKDKTFVRGDILIDDKPKIEGAMNPEWEHVVFDRPYNRDVTGQRRITWQNWQEVLAELTRAA